MARIGISITKEVGFRDSIQPFSNVYFYENGFLGSFPGEAGAEGLIDGLVALEKTFHSSLVEFTFARCWSQGPTEAGNEMIFQKPLTGTGSTAMDNGLDRERAYLFRWRAGSDTRGKPVYLRKWYHSCGAFPGVTIPLGATLVGNLVGFSTAQRSAMQTNAAAVTERAGDNGPWRLCSKGGREVDVDTPEAHRYLEHHQLGDQWRGA